MPLYRIRLLNSDFESSVDGDYESLEAAQKAAITAAIELASEEITNGVANLAIELCVEADDKLLARRVVSLSVADLAVDGPLFRGDEPPR